MKRSRRHVGNAGSDVNPQVNNSDNAANGLKPGRFRLKAPSAKSVRLAADFTEWEKCPLDLVKAEDGTWELILPLSLGNHSYRFIVDGQWHNDPQAALSTPNPFGTENSVIVIA